MAVEVRSGYVLTVYRDNKGTGRPVEGHVLRTRLGAGRHLVVVAAGGAS